MKPFCADAKCVKCHGEDISTVHYPDAKTEDCYDRNHGTRRNHPREEYMHRRCRRCHYDWHEKPLDAAA